MGGLLERRADGSLALFIDGDLQFDSRDENVYHEGLVLPALSVASKRSPTPFRVLLVGGGDGLSARELLKSSSVAYIDLVDYDPGILEMARTELSGLNNGSLIDERVRTHVRDAWQYVDEALAQGNVYDLIISDLTVADCWESARFHSVDWYEKIGRLLTPGGLLAANGVSPDKTPLAFWSIFNSICKGGLLPVPYHVTIPSFAERDYGKDWGFFLASNKLIVPSELNVSTLAEPRHFLQEQNQLCQLFQLPEQLLELQSQALPALAGSDILLQYFHKKHEWTSSDALRDAFSIDVTTITIPEADNGKDVLPAEVSLALARVMDAQSNTTEIVPADPALVLREVLDLMPSLRSDVTADLIADFLQEPAVFLQGVDLPGLVSRLLQRAGSLPAQLVAELQSLSEKLKDWAGDHLSLMQMGAQVVTLVTLIMVIGNLLYPDMVYAKGDAGHGGAHAGAHGGGHEGHAGGGGHAYGGGGHAYGGGGRGYGGRGYGGGVYGGGTVYGGTNTVDVYNRRTNVQGPPRNIIVPGTNTVTPKRQPLPPQSSLPADGNALHKIVRDASATIDMLTADRSEAANFRQLLLREVEQYKGSSDAQVLFGTRLTAREEAMRLMDLEVMKTELKINLLDSRLAQLQAEISAAKIALAQSEQEA